MEDLLTEPPPLAPDARAERVSEVEQQRLRPERGAKSPRKRAGGPASSKCSQRLPIARLFATLPAWAAEMRDLFRSGSAAQFLLHGNVFDVVPHDGKLLSLPAFLDEVMFASYDVVLHYDRSRGVRATRGGEDWGDWLQNALGPRGRARMTLLREPGSALELIDRYLLRTLNLQALPGGAAAGKPQTDRRHHRVRRVRRAARRRAAARRAVRGQRRQGARLGQRSRDRPVQHRHRAPQRRPARSQRARGREPARRGAAPAAAGRSGHARVPDGALDDAVSGHDGEVRRADRDTGGAADRPEPRRRAHGDRAGARQRQADHVGVARPDQEGARSSASARACSSSSSRRSRSTTSPASSREGVASRGHGAPAGAAPCARCRWGT